MQTVSAMFDSYSAAARAVDRLKSAGIPEADVSIVGGDAGMRSDPATGYATTSDPVAEDSASGAGTGATLGAVVGGGAGMLAGLGTLAIPGIGPIVAAGWLAATLLGATAGGAAGGLIGALTGAGISETEAHEYTEGLRRGGTLVTVRAADQNVAQAISILDAEGRVDMQQRTGSWRSEGWTGRYEDAPAPGGRSAQLTAAPHVDIDPITGQARPIRTDVELDDRRGIAGTGTTDSSGRKI